MILKETVKFEVEVATRIVCIAVKLHNFCLEENPVPTGFMSGIVTAERLRVREESA